MSQKLGTTRKINYFYFRVRRWKFLCTTPYFLFSIKYFLLLEWLNNYFTLILMNLGLNQQILVLSELLIFFLSLRSNFTRLNYCHFSTTILEKRGWDYVCSIHQVHFFLLLSVISPFISFILVLVSSLLNYRIEYVEILNLNIETSSMSLNLKNDCKIASIR